MKEVPIHVEHVLGRLDLRDSALTIGELLAANRLPETLFQPYAITGEHAAPLPLATPLADLPAGTEEVIVRAIRNTLFSTVMPTQAPDALRPELGYGVGFRGVRNDKDETASEAHAVVDAGQARGLIVEQVRAFDEQYDVKSGGCLFGVSGGGDSNALAVGLSSTLPPDRLSAFTLVFGPVFSEAAADRASVLCLDLGIEHRVLRPPDIAAVLGITTSVDELYADFCSAFTDEALHFFGTFLILRTARRLANEKQFTNLAFGYNREDLLAEALFMLMNGNAPLSFPVRSIGRHRVVMPVWKAPKLLLDACHPTFSLENYRERDAFTTRQRSTAFFLAHTLDSSYPSFGLSLLTGLASALDGMWGEVHHEEEADLFVTAQASPASIARVSELLQRHFV